MQLAARRLHQTVRNDIIGYHCHRPDDGALPDAHKLMKTRKAANNDVVLYHTMARHCRVIDQDHPVVDLHIMRHMAPGHKQAIIANLR